jgi:hypothetical protein
MDEVGKEMSGYQQIKPPIRIDRLARVKGWLEARRAIAVDPLGYGFAYRVAEIVRKTYVICGDAATIPDDKALMMINDMLLKLDVEMLKISQREQYRRNRRTQAKILKKNKYQKKLLRRGTR